MENAVSCGCGKTPTISLQILNAAGSLRDGVRERGRAEDTARLHPPLLARQAGRLEGALGHRQDELRDSSWSVRGGLPDR